MPQPPRPDFSQAPQPPQTQAPGSPPGYGGRQAPGTPGTPGTPGFPTPEPKRGFLETTRGLVIVGVVSGLLTFAIAGAGIYALTRPADVPSAASASSQAADNTATTPPTPEPEPAAVPDTAKEEPAPTTEAPAPTQPPVLPPETTGKCPASTNELRMGTTKDFEVRICEGPTQVYTYVGGNTELGFIVLPAEISFSTAGTIYTASNGDTTYQAIYDGLRVTPAGGEAWVQQWHSGNMTSLRQ